MDNGSAAGCRKGPMENSLYRLRLRPGRQNDFANLAVPLVADLDWLDPLFGERRSAWLRDRAGQPLRGSDPARPPSSRRSFLLPTLPLVNGLGRLLDRLRIHLSTIGKLPGRSTRPPLLSLDLGNG